MKAILMTTAGDPDVLKIADIPEPTIQSPTELIVRLKAAGINPIDTKLRSRGTFHPDRLPSILGCDGAGIVEAIGADVTKFKIGDEVSVVIRDREVLAQINSFNFVEAKTKAVKK